jgi:hypothetical protein
MQRIEDKIGRITAAGMHGDRLAAKGNLDPVDVSLPQNLLMAVARRNRGIVVLVTHQRQRTDAGGDRGRGFKPGLGAAGRPAGGRGHGAGRSPAHLVFADD